MGLEPVQKLLTTANYYTGLSGNGSETSKYISYILRFPHRPDSLGIIILVLVNSFFTSSYASVSMASIT